MDKSITLFFISDQEYSIYEKNLGSDLASFDKTGILCKSNAVFPLQKNTYPLAFSIAL